MAEKEKRVRTNEISKRIMALMEEKGTELAWSKKELLAQLARWQEEFAAETKRLSQTSSDKGLDLATASSFLTELTSRQRNRQEEIANWQKKISSLQKRRQGVESELSKILAELTKTQG